MRLNRAQSLRRGSILPLVALALVGLVGFVALAVDIGMIAVAKTQCQNAADAAAMTAVRSIDGSASPDFDGAVAKAKAVANANDVLTTAVQNGEVIVQFGTYHYDTANAVFVSVPDSNPASSYFNSTFTPQQYTPLPTGDNYNLARAKISLTPDAAFARVFGLTTFDVVATATAAHRPRDFAIILDFSGSMNNESDLWNNEGYLGSANNTTNNTDAVVPTFGHYSSSGAGLVYTGSDSRVGKCNVTHEVLGVPPLVDDFYQHTRGATAQRAFSYVPYVNLYDPPSGDQYKPRNGTSTTPPTFGQHSQDITGSTTTPFGGYGPTFAGYTQGPGYWGKTPFIWPPDPDYNTAGDPSSGINARTGYPASLSSPPRDWRRRFFLKPGGSHPSFGGQMDENWRLYDPANGNWRDPIDNNGTNYVINYRAILDWIKNSGANPFPAQLRASRILYYSAIPDDVPASAYQYDNPNSQIADANQRFWKEYIDYTLGVWLDPYGTATTVRNTNRSNGSTRIQRPGNPACAYGPDFTWGTARIATSAYTYTGPEPDLAWMRHDDNPKRPRNRFWFGPMTMVQFISDTGLNPGTAHDISMFPAKLGIAGALKNIENNHPNDLVSMILFNRPVFNDDPPGIGNFAQAQFSLSRNYAAMRNALWYPPNSSSLDVRPWDTNGLQTPRSFADYTSNTCTIHGLMLAYNQFSGSSTLRSALVGGYGRKGAQRIVILETDGMANVNSDPVAGFQDNGAYSSYYRILPGDTVNSAGFNRDNLLKVVMALTNKDDGAPPFTPLANQPYLGASYPTNPGYPGYSTPRKPVLIHTIGFGPVFEPTASGSEPTNAKQLLQQVSYLGGTVYPDSSTDAENGFKWCIGTMDERKNKLKTAFLKIMDSSVTVTLIH